MRLRRRPAAVPPDDFAGIALRGRLWPGGASAVIDDGCVVIDEAGDVVACGPAAAVDVPSGVEIVQVGWVGPGIVDEHVHLAFGAPEEMLRHGVVAVRDLGAPPAQASRWRQLPAPRVEVAGPLLTAPGGYPSRSWGSAGFAAFVDDVDQAQRLVTGLCEQTDVIKLALEPAAGPVPTPEVCRAVVTAAHDGGRRVTCHALSVEMVERAVDAGVDELAHTPTEPLPDEVVSRVAAAAITVVSTLQTFVHGGVGRAAVDNATRLVAAGVALRYGTDLGNGGTRPGVDPRELRLLAGDVGLGWPTALAAATQPIVVGAGAGLVALDHDPVERPDAWRTPRAVVVGSTSLLRR